MTAKYKLGFTGSAEMLFAVMAKLLPDALEVEVREVSPPEHVPDPVYPRISKVAQQVAKMKPERAKQVRKTKGSGYALNPFAGANAIILAAFSDGEPHPGNVCFASMKAAGFATNGVYGKFERLRRHKFMFQPRPGLWQLTSEGKKLWDTRPAREAVHVKSST